MATRKHLKALLRFAEQKHRYGKTGDIPAWNAWRANDVSLKPDLSGANLQNLCLDDADFSWTDFRGADLRGVHAYGADFICADLSNSLVGRETPKERPWWSTAEAELSAAKLRFAKLVDADLRGVFLSASDLTKADLSGAKLHRASLRDARLTDTRLDRADLREVDLRGAQIGNASLTQTQFGGALFGGTLIYGLDLSETHGLDQAIHEAPSSIDFNTIIRSRGTIPEAFLRGCGLPDAWIRAISITRPSEYLSCFISYSHSDEAFCRKLYDHLRAAGLRVWFSPEEVKGGRKLHEQIYEAIERHDRLVVVLSEHSMASEWVKTEMRRARKREVEKNMRVLFPISLVPFDRIRGWEAFDADTGKDIAVEIREYFIPDFSKWEEEHLFDLEVRKLVAALEE
jgi:uncharacterized protein YjbI with pentapeptide repeats